MTWYYAISGQQHGPVTEADIQALIKSGAIKPDTLVWREGMANWAPCGDVLPAALSGQAASPAEPAPPLYSVCSQCHRSFSPDEVISLGHQWVCAECKPILLQKIREGVVVNPYGLAFASFGQRAGAKIIDWIIEGVVTNVPAFFLGFSSCASGNALPELTPIFLQIGITLFSLLFSMAYNVFFLAKYQATPGKLLLKIKVVRADGSRLTTGRCFGRYFAEVLTRCTCIGYFLPLWDDQRRALHDHIADTRVVVKQD